MTPDRACGKVRHPSRASALAHAASLRKTGRACGEVEVYRCPACGGCYHVGRPPRLHFGALRRDALRAAWEAERLAEAEGGVL